MKRTALPAFIRAIVVIGAVASSSACAETHALIMAISEYGWPGATPLKGAAKDVASAQDIARRLGVKDANMRVLRNDELTHAGMTQALNALDERIANGDELFIYYSGHGSRQRVSDPEERCAESLVTYDGYGFIDAELERRLKLLSAKASKLVMFIDACHSGGVTTRGAGDARFTPKFAATPHGDACQTPVNVLKRSIALGARAAGSGAQNYVYIAAARDNEVSLDEEGKGGIATQAWHQCVAGAARDLDASGAITADEVRVCAQQLIDEKLKSIDGFTPHHISITGNARAVLDFAAAQPEPAPEPMRAAPAETLRDIYGQRDDRRIVSVELRQPELTIGRDALQFSVTSSHAGYVYLLMAGSDGATFDIVFPNQLDAANEIRAGETLRLPRAAWQLKAAGPPGTTHLLAMVTDAPRDFSTLGMQAAGPFSILEANTASAKRIQRASALRARGAGAECPEAMTHVKTDEAKRCSNAFGAALVGVEERAR